MLLYYNHCYIMDFSFKYFEDKVIFHTCKTTQCHVYRVPYTKCNARLNAEYSKVGSYFNSWDSVTKSLKYNFS